MNQWARKELALLHKYDEPTNIKYKELKSIIKQLGFDKNFTVLEIGCGNGSLADYLNKEFKNVKYSGVDINPICINTAIKHRNSGTFICADIEELSLLDTEKFDLCIFDKTLELLHSPEDTIAKLLNISKYIIINYPAHHEDRIKAINTPMRWNGMCDDSPLWKFTLEFFEDIAPIMNLFPFIVIKKEKYDLPEFKNDDILEKMQTKEAQDAMKMAFDASPKDLGKAAVTMAKKKKYI